MDKKQTPAPFEPGKVTTVERLDDSPKMGEWFWVLRDDNDSPDYVEWLGCVVKELSNAVEIWSPKAKSGGYKTARVHRDQFKVLLRFEPNAEAVIREKIAHYKGEIDRLMAAIESDKASLGLVQLGQATRGAQPEVNAVAVISGVQDVKAYEASLVALKERLPVAQAELKGLIDEWGRWVNAETLPMESMRDSMKQSMEEIDGRIFNVSLYAGLTEDTVQFAQGAPASIDEKLHLMQRRLYMDEECLLGYDTGGIDISNSNEFRAWLAIPSNRDRILPFPRCIVSMQMRRNEKERDWKGNLGLLRHNAIMGISDKSTYLFIRNGDNLHQLVCDLDFGVLIFPEKAAFDNSEPMMFKPAYGSAKETMTRREYDHLVERQQELRVKREQWFKDNPQQEWEAKNPKKCWSYFNPYREGSSFCAREWAPLDHSSVYYDEAMKNIQDQIMQYNRIALIIQGLFDRKDMLEPSHPLKSWDPVSFARSIELVYDGTGLYHGDVPDFQEYMAQCNAQITATSVLVGQDDVWQRREADKEYARYERSRRSSNEQSYRPTHVKPFGDPGPGYIAVPDRLSRGKAVFTWYREGREFNSLIAASISVPYDKLFNISAYKPGDFQQFFRDPRTRGRYLQWAPMLLAAEDYHAGLRKAQMPGCGPLVESDD